MTVEIIDARSDEIIKFTDRELTDGHAYEFTIGDDDKCIFIASHDPLTDVRAISICGKYILRKNLINPVYVKPVKVQVRIFSAS